MMMKSLEDTVKVYPALCKGVVEFLTSLVSGTYGQT